MDLVQKLKIVFVIDTLQIGGAEQSLLENSIRFSSIKPIVCHLYKGDNLKSRFLENNVKVYSFNIDKAYGFAQAYHKLKKVVEIENPDILVGYLTRSEIITRLVGRIKNIPVVGTFISDLYCRSYNKHLTWKARKLVSLFKMINSLTCKICSGFIANSQAVKYANSKHLSVAPEKIKVIYRGRESSRFKCRNFDQRNSSTVRFLNVSRLYPVKAHKQLILGFKLFIQQYPNATLEIIGNGPMRPELTKLISDNELEEKVFLLGERNDVPSIIWQYDCFVFPSLVEGFSGALVEAMFAGLPVLASNIPQNMEVVTHLETGYLFNKESSEEIARAMVWFKENEDTAATLAKNAYTHARENFELDKIVGQMEAYLHTVIAKGK